jgi:hypothetical protein
MFHASACLAGLLLCGLPALSSRAALAPGPDQFGYSVATTTAFSFTNLTATGTKVLNFDDDTTVTVNLGFSFNFYGSNYSTVSFSPNGLMTFAGASGQFSNVNLATTAPAGDLPTVAVFWDDYDTQIPGADAVYYRTIGAPGSRQFIVQWNDMVLVQGVGVDPVTFAARLFEESNQILFSFQDVVVSDDPGSSQGAVATVGIRDWGGHLNQRALLWSHNQVAVTNGLHLLFTPTNHPPTARDDLALTRTAGAVTIRVLTNDYDLDGHTLRLVSAGPALHGETETNLDGTVTYRASTNFFGEDRFPYVVGDGRGGTSTGLVVVTVWPPLRIDRIGWEPDRVRLEFSSIPGRLYDVEATTNLVQWQMIGTADEVTPASFEFEDPPPFPARFYRLRER